VEDCNWETIFYGHYRSIFNLTQSACNPIEFGEKKTQNKGYYAVQVIQGHRDWYQLKARMRLSIGD